MGEPPKLRGRESRESVSFGVRQRAHLKKI